ncbi:ABC-type xenobiotic transporter [Ranunculus cassubicifolius]
MDIEKDKTATKSVSLLSVLKYSDSKDVVLMILGTIGCCADGISMAAIMVVLSKVMNGYASKTSLTLHEINKYAFYFLYVAIGVGTGAFLEGFCWARTADRQTSRLCKNYLRAVLRQDVCFFDKRHGISSTSRVVSSISTDTLTIQSVLSEKIPNFIMNITMFITAQIGAAYLCWRLAIVGIPALSMLIIPGLVYGKLLMGIGQKIYKSYAVAGGIAEQALSSIRVVFSYVGETRTVESFSAALQPSLNLGIKQGLLKGLAIGSIGLSFLVWALQAWYGSILVTEKGQIGGDVFTAGVCIIYGGLALGSSLINLRYFSEASIAASGIFEMIEHVPTIDSNDHQGVTISSVEGELKFEDVDFAYPSRPEHVILTKFNLNVMAGQTLGLVGRSGSGKSTVISLIERFYNPIKGNISLDGISIKTLNLKWFRSQMSLVSQEPVLFATSIKENILFGKEGASMEEVINAAKAANAHNFICNLPKGYDTSVGQLGTHVSEGQKQRIAIARALIKDPKILLLDEATSALDSQSEKAVQDALDQASFGRTTIIIAHRFSALRNAHAIAVIQSGTVAECGPHEQLLQKKSGPYSAMLQLQKTLTQDGPSFPPTQLGSNILQTTEAAYGIDASESFYKVESTDSKSKQPQEDKSMWHLMKMTAPEWKHTIMGCVAALFYGLTQPLHSFCQGAILTIFFLDNPEKIRSQTKVYCFLFIVLAVFAVVSNVIQHYNFGIMGEHLTKRVRETMLAKVLTFEIGWFDQESNSSGALCSRLATDAGLVRTLVADRASFVAQSISATCLAVILGMMLSWRLALVILAIQPLIVGSFYFKAVVMRNMSKKLVKAQNESTLLASDAVGNHRTITAFSSQDKVMELFEVSLKGPKMESQRQSWYAGFVLFVSQFLTAANTGLLYWYGGRLLYNGQITYKHLFQTFFIMVTAGRVIAETGSMTQDLSKGTNALKAFLEILGRKTQMNSDDPDGIKPEKIDGDIELKEVLFSYPARPKQIILADLSFKVPAGRTVALVGQSGCGKSTVIRLIERFYDPSKGTVAIDGIDIRSYNLRSLRSHIALVSQEPTLFAGTIHENIVYGKENATEAEVTNAAALANAHEFISSMKDGYETYCGERGIQLSGGQKQRIALARAILKSPAILLLDEATSALDSRSENLVHDAIDKMMVGRTCLIVAHRLSSIQKSDTIAVIDHMRIVEEGTHTDLLAKGENSAYYSLIRLQQYGSSN